MVMKYLTTNLVIFKSQCGNTVIHVFIVVVQVILLMWHFGENYFLMPLYALIHALPDGKTKKNVIYANI